MEGLIRRWRQLGVWLPVGFVALVTVVGVLGVGRFLSDWAVVLVITGLTAAGAVAFSSWAFNVMGRAQREAVQRARHLSAINQASLALASELDLGSLLQRVVDLSREVTDADYGALAMLDEDKRITQFITSGMDAELRGKIDHLPRGSGLLGVVIHDEKALRCPRISDDPRSSGFPPHHPVMTSFVGLPITYEGRLVGDLYLTDKNGGEPFTRGDEEMLRIFAAHAAIAIENARLYQQVQDLVVLEERDRIGMDLHDGVIQSLYATGLMLEGSLEDVRQDPASVQPQLQNAIQNLNKTIADIRSYVFNLRPGVLADTDLAGAVGALLQELKVNALLEVQLIEEPGACRGLSSEEINALYHVAQESLTNVRKHAKASSVRATLRQNDGTFRMTVEDDGVGFDVARPGSGQGLRNMQERVEALGGHVSLDSGNGRGTTLTVELRLDGASEAGARASVPGG